VEAPEREDSRLHRTAGGHARLLGASHGLGHAPDRHAAGVGRDGEDRRPRAGFIPRAVVEHAHRGDCRDQAGSMCRPKISRWLAYFRRLITLPAEPSIRQAQLKMMCRRMSPVLVRGPAAHVTGL